MPLVLAQSLAAPKLPVSLPALSFPSSVPCTSSLKHKHVSMKTRTPPIFTVQLFYIYHTVHRITQHALKTYLLYFPVLAPSAPPASVLKCGVSPRPPGATDRPSLGEVVLRPLAPPSKLLSPRLGDFSARHASATTERKCPVDGSIR